MASTILIAEDEELLRQSLAGLLEEEGYEILQAADGKAAYEQIVERPVDLVLTDIRMPEMDGLALLERIRQTAPETPVILMTAYGTVESAISALRAGGWDYLLKPVQFDDLLAKVRHALEFRELAQDRRILTEQLAAQGDFHNLVSESPVMLKLFDQVRKLADVKSTVLLEGESGTGKELFARAIHFSGTTAGKPFLPVNCGAIPETLVASELFGHRKGSFTGAIADKRGYFEAAHGGTIFLDEISTLPPPVQSTLLRVLEERAVTPVGDTWQRPVDVRVITATNRDLESLVREGEFREDLFYRLNVVKLLLPPLRQRRGDIPLLVHHFLEKYCAEMGKKALGITNAAMRALLNQEWRGNVRELENVVERAVIFAEDSRIGVEDLPFAVDADAGTDDDEDLKSALSQFERQHIIASLRRHNYDKAETARSLGIGVSSLYRKLDDLGIPKNLQETDAT
ncbi:MAG: sigma-54-dependent transcriptional regulator [Planctomycetota bacterium]|jgi:two-component system response regulator PilR (NtrC family)